MQPYYDIHNLNSYTNVNPAAESGQRLMDAGTYQNRFLNGMDAGTYQTRESISQR